ncbi:MAG: hypothetical protein NZM28_02510 [Fimbriimonadales bacterium]|nr:hypothetical protein [Fimbriimonadales bacterium]
MPLIVKNARYSGNALWLDEPLNVPDNATVQVAIWLPEEARSHTEAQLHRLHQWLGAVKGVSVPLEHLNRGNLYDD